MYSIKGKTTRWEDYTLAEGADSTLAEVEDGTRGDWKENSLED